jgi:putative endonuclease
MPNWPNYGQFARYNGNSLATTVTMESLSGMKDSGHLQIGRIGEDSACTYLKGKGYQIVERNYRRSWGELDIVARKDNKLHFIEVKATANVSGARGRDRFRAEEHVDHKKRMRLRRIIQSYLSSCPEVDWLFHVVVARINFDNRSVRIQFLENVILE